MRAVPLFAETLRADPLAGSSRRALSGPGERACMLVSSALAASGAQGTSGLWHPAHWNSSSIKFVSWLFSMIAKSSFETSAKQQRTMWHHSAAVVIPLCFRCVLCCPGLPSVLSCLLTLYWPPRCNAFLTPASCLCFSPNSRYLFSLCD